MIEIVLFSVALGSAWADYLVAEDGIFDFVPGWIHRITTNKKWNTVLWECSICVSGQISLWTYLAIHYQHYNLFDHASIVSVTIVAAGLLKRIMRK